MITQDHWIRRCAWSSRDRERRTLWDVVCYYIPHYSPAAFCNL